MRLTHPVARPWLYDQIYLTAFSQRINLVKASSSFENTAASKNYICEFVFLMNIVLTKCLAPEIKQLELSYQKSACPEST